MNHAAVGKSSLVKKHNLREMGIAPDVLAVTHSTNLCYINIKLSDEHMAESFIEFFVLILSFKVISLLARG